MARTRSAIVSPAWAPFFEETKIPAAALIGDQLHVSGHTGEDHDGHFPPDMETQVRGTFRNLAETLAEAGADWSDVVSMTSYHVGLRGHEEVVLGVAGEFLKSPFPAWTATGVTELWPPDALIEISCIAVLRAARA